MPSSFRAVLFSFAALSLLLSSVAAAPKAVTVLLPAEGRHFWPDERILLAANPAEDAAGIARVTWQVDGKDVGQSSSPPFHLVIPAPARGRHAVRAVATMKDGSRMESAPVSFRSVGHPYEGWDLELEVVGPSETPKARPPRKPPVAAPGAPQGLCLAIDNSERATLPGDGEGCVGEVFEIITSDGRPPVNQAARLPLEGNVSSDAQMRRLGAFRYHQKAKAWVSIPGAKVDEETLEMVVPVAQPGRYAVAGLLGAPRPKPVIRWLHPAEGATVRGRVDLLVLAGGDDAAERTDFVLERIGGAPIKAFVEGGMPLAIVPQAWKLPLDDHLARIPWQPGEDRDDERTHDDPVDGVLPFDFDLVASGTYRLTASLPFSDGKVTAVRNIRVQSSLKIPTVMISPKALRPGQGIARIEGTVTPGTIPVESVYVIQDGVIVGRADITHPFAAQVTGKEVRPVRWRWESAPPIPPGRVGASAGLTAIAFDAMGNRSAPAKMLITRPAPSPKPKKKTR